MKTLWAMCKTKTFSVCELSVYVYVYQPSQMLKVIVVHISEDES